MKNKYIIYKKNEPVESNDAEVVKFCENNYIYEVKCYDSNHRCEFNIFLNEDHEDMLYYIAEKVGLGFNIEKDITYLELESPIVTFSEFGYKFVDQLSSGAYYFVKED